MRVLTINELMRMTRKELCGLAAHISAGFRPTAKDRPAAPRRSSTCATFAGLWRADDQNPAKPLPSPKRLHHWSSGRRSKRC